MADLQWHYASGGQKHGPIAEAALLELLSSGALAADALVWNRSMKAWTPASQVPAFAAVVNVPPPLPESPSRSVMTFFFAKAKAAINLVWAKFAILSRLTKVGVIAGAMVVLLVGWIWIFADHRSTQQQIYDSNNKER